MSAENTPDEEVTSQDESYYGPVVTVTYEDMLQLEYHGKEDVRPLYGRHEVKSIEDIKNGNFVIPKEAYAVYFSYDRFEIGTIRHKGINYKNIQKDRSGTGYFYPDGKVYMREQLAQLKDQEALYKKMTEDRINYYIDDHRLNYAVEDRNGMFHVFGINDMIITGKDKEWKVVQIHPGTDSNREYLNYKVQ